MVAKLSSKKSSGFLGSFRKILLVLCLVLGGYVLYKGYYISQHPVEIRSRPVAEDDSAFEEIVFPANQDFLSYENSINLRDIFSSPYGRSRIPIPEKTPETATEPVPLGEEYKLIGIVLDKNPQAIVKKLGNDETLFLSVGDKMDNAVLQEIKENKVIFMYQNKKVFLTTEESEKF